MYLFEYLNFNKILFIYRSKYTFSLILLILLYIIQTYKYEYVCLKCIEN